MQREWGQSTLTARPMNWIGPVGRSSGEPLAGSSVSSKKSPDGSRAAHRFPGGGRAVVLADPLAHAVVQHSAGADAGGPHGAATPVFIKKKDCSSKVF